MLLSSPVITPLDHTKKYVHNDFTEVSLVYFEVLNCPFPPPLWRIKVHKESSVRHEMSASFYLFAQPDWKGLLNA